MMLLANLLISLLFPLVLALVAGLVGRLVWRPPRWDGETLGVTVTLGLGTLATLALGLGLVGWLRPVPVALLTAGLVAVALARDRQSLRATGRMLWQGGGRSLRWGGMVATGTMAFLALYPPTGFDATVYHLPYAKAFMRSGEVSFLGDVLYPIFPQLQELLFTLGFLVTDARTAQMTQVLAALLTALLLYGWGRRRVSRRAGVWAAALWLGTPLVVWIGASAYIDVGLTLCVTAAVVSWDRWHSGEGNGWLAVAAACAGFAAGGKYLGLFFCAALGVMTVLRRGVKDRWTAVGLFSGIALLTAAPWYLRIVYHTGNPLFPFYTSLFGVNAWSTAADGLSRLPGETGEVGLWTVLGHQWERVREGVVFLLWVPWRGTFDRAVFHYQAPLSPAFLGLLPVAALLVWRRTAAWRWLLLTLAYALLWLTTLREIRFLLPILPLFILGLWTVVEPRLPTWRWLGPVVALALFLPGPMYAVYKTWERGPLPITGAAEERYLTARLPGYGAVAWLNGQTEQGGGYTLYTLYGHRLQYYAEGRLLGNWFGPQKYAQLLDQRGDPAGICRELHAMGASHFLELDHPRLTPLVRARGTVGCLIPLYGGEGYQLYRVL